MEVLNIHSRKINKPVNDVLELFNTLSAKSDKIWPFENWPPMRFKNGLEKAG